MARRLSDWAAAQSSGWFRISDAAPVTIETLTERRLNRALLARQGLLEPFRTSLVDVLERVGGIQTQYAPSGYTGLWTRMADFERTNLTRALESREAIQATLMRMTIHTVSARDYWPMAVAVRDSRRDWFRRVNRRAMAEIDVEAHAAEVRRELDQGPLKLAELTRRLTARGLPDVPIGWVSLWLDLVRVPPCGTWERRRADLYGLADQWIKPPERLTFEDATDLLVRRYLEAFGPAHLPDIVSWAGIPSPIAHAATERLGVLLYRDEHRKKLIDLPGAPLPSEDTTAPVRFLPTWDATLLVHARRTQILPEKYRSLVFNTKMPQSVGTFLVDGQVRGSWRFESGHVSVQPFEALSKQVTREVDQEAERLTAFHA